LLYIIPTPIGNLEDITLRALRLLGDVNYILAEDTRTSTVLLTHYSIATPLRPFHAFNEHNVVNTVIGHLKAGQTIALISDAGTPGISDPAYLLVNECIKNNIKVECLPGATAFVPALIVSGFPVHYFVFKGFVPHKKGRQSFLQQAASSECTIVFYESPHRLIKTLQQLQLLCEMGRQVSVSREISKKFEETRRGNLTDVTEYFKKNQPKGEFVIVLESNINR